MDADKITNFFKFHVEKMILVVVVLASVFMLYSGFKQPDYLAKHDPDQLKRNATQVRGDIDVNHNDAIFSALPLRKPTFDIVAATKRRDEPVNHGVYSLGNPWDGSTPPGAMVRRYDPVLSPPRALMTFPVITTIARRYPEQEYPVSLLEPAEELEKIVAPVKRERRPRRQNMMMMEEEDMMEMGMEEDMAMEEDMFGGESMAGMRKFNSEYNFGASVGPTEDKRFPRPQLAMFIAGTAVIPHKEMYESYQAALKDADDYQPRRDTPFYYNFEVQRADVTDKAVADLADADWIDVWNRTLYTNLAAKYWSGFAPEIVPNDYRDSLVTMWIPPVLLDDYSTFCLHPLIPMESQVDIKARTGVDEEILQDVDIDTILNTTNVELAAPGQRGSGYGGGEGMMDMGEMEMDDDMGMGFLGYGATIGLDEDPVDYKLLRFYDFTIGKKAPKPGRKYVYRLRFAVNDPNFPANRDMQPKINTLNADAATRVLDLMANAKATGKRSYERWTEWSDPSDPTSLPTNEDYFAGPVEPGTTNMWTVGNKRVPYVRDPPKAKIVASQFSVEYATRVPLRMEVTEGSTLSATAETADIVDPISLNVKKLESPKLLSPTTIVDLDGGGKLSITDGLTEPGLMLMFDRSGKLIVTDDVDDQEFYRIYSYAEERGE